MADGMFGVDVVPVPWTLLFFTLAAPGGYSVWAQTGLDSHGDPLFALEFGITVATIGAYNQFAFASALPVTPHVAYIATGDPNGGNLDAIIDSFSYGVTTVSSVNPYIPVAPVLATEPGDTHVDLSWSAAETVSADARMELVYYVRRGTTSPPSSYIVLDPPLSGLTYDDTGRTNGTTYYYLVQADIRIVGDTGSGLGQSKNSNIAAATPVDPPDVIDSTLDLSRVRFRIS